MASDAAAHPLKCLECRASLVSPMVCSGCETLGTFAQSTDYFELLGLERRYHLDEAKLALAFRALIRNLHPDRYGGQPAEVRAFAMRMCAELNQAYRVLADPTLRASYMLELVGGPSATQVRGAPGNLLAEVVMIREKIDHARAALPQRSSNCVRC
ncbi:MAG: DnaJ domain-containing protein [Planctomycetes bacterium]|nr:DnaJ domain-containing protein [Planctomycetota bacterium]